MFELPPRRPTPVPLHIISGLLGSGKTSFIQYQLDHDWAGQKLGLILCEEGAIKLDVSRAVEPRIKRLLNACVCCEMAYTFFEVIVELLQDRDIERIVVEITAQADVEQIFDFIRSSHLREFLQFEPIHVLVDARNPHMRFDAPAPMIRRLMNQADCFVLSFHDADGARPFHAGGKRVRLSPAKGTETESRI